MVGPRGVVCLKSVPSFSLTTTLRNNVGESVLFFFWYVIRVHKRCRTVFLTIFSTYKSQKRYNTIQFKLTVTTVRKAHNNYNNWKLRLCHIKELKQKRKQSRNKRRSAKKNDIARYSFVFFVFFCCGKHFCYRTFRRQFLFLPFLNWPLLFTFFGRCRCRVVLMNVARVEVIRLVYLIYSSFFNYVVAYILISFNLKCFYLSLSLSSKWTCFKFCEQFSKQQLNIAFVNFMFRILSYCDFILRLFSVYSAKLWTVLTITFLKWIRW